MCGQYHRFSKATAAAWMSCPFHAALFVAVSFHNFEIVANQGVKSADGGDSPFFLTSSGERITAAMVGEY